MALSLAGLAAPAAARDDAAQVTGLFVAACLAHSGDAAGTRAWAAGAGMRRLPERARAAFMGAAPGVAFDATNAAGKFVLLSADDGGCAAVADRADATAMAAALEAYFRTAGIAFDVTEARDPKEPAVTARSYRARKDARRWDIVASGVPGDPGAHAMITAR